MIAPSSSFAQVPTSRFPPKILYKISSLSARAVAQCTALFSRAAQFHHVLSVCTSQGAACKVHRPTICNMRNGPARLGIAVRYSTLRSGTKNRHTNDISPSSVSVKIVSPNKSVRQNNKAWDNNPTRAHAVHVYSYSIVDPTTNLPIGERIDIAQWHLPP